MTPREVDAPAVQAKLGLLRQLLDDLEPLADVTGGRLVADRPTRYMVERILTQLVDIAVSINSHLAAATLRRAPTEYRESFRLAAQAGAIGPDLAAELSLSVGLRNVLTHEYTDVDLEIVASSVPEALRGYRRYVAAVAAFLLRAASHHDGT